MKHQRQALAIIFEELELDPLFSNHEDRQMLQKIVYIVQSCRIDLGYTFGWYTTGVFCPELREDLYILRSDIQRGNEYNVWRYRPNNKIKAILGNIKTVINSNPVPELTKYQWLQLISSLIDSQCVEMNEEKIKERVGRVNKTESEHIETAKTVLKKHLGADDNK